MYETEFLFRSAAIMTVLQRRFFFSSSLLVRYMQIFGIVLDSSQVGRYPCKRYVIRCWAWLCLGLHIQGNTFIYIYRTTAPTEHQKTLNFLIEIVNDHIYRAGMALLNPVAHFLLMCVLCNKMVAFLNDIEHVDWELGRPSLSTIRNYSLAGVGWNLITVHLQYVKMTFYNYE